MKLTVGRLRAELEKYDDDQALMVSVEIDSIPSEEAVRVQCYQYWQVATDCEGQDVILSVSGDFNEDCKVVVV